MAVTFEKLMQSLKEKKYQPVYFLHGPEPFFIDQVTNYIADNVLTDSEKGFNQLVVYGKDTDVDTIIGAAKRYPLMSQYQVVIVKEAQQLKNLPELEKYLEKPVPTTILVLAHKYKSLDKRLKIYKLIEKNTVLFESKKLDEKKLPEWINAYLAQHGKKIKPQAALLMAEYLGSDLEQVTNALNKLVLAKNDDAPIDEKDIEVHVGISREYNVFELQNALGNRDIKKTSKILDYILSHPKVNPLPFILVVLYGYFTKVTAAQFGMSNLKALGVPDFFAKDYQRAVDNYKGKMKKIMQILQEYDLRSKGVNDVGTEEGELMKEMIFKILYV